MKYTGIYQPQPILLRVCPHQRALYSIHRYRPVWRDQLPLQLKQSWRRAVHFLLHLEITHIFYYLAIWIPFDDFLMQN